MGESEPQFEAAMHPGLGGKSLAMVERPPYKSWRKKYRKIRSKFDAAMEENKRLFREEQKLEGLARRLKEELDGLLELCLDLNQNPALPPSLRWDVSLDEEHTAIGTLKPSIPPNITPEEANAKIAEYTTAVQRGQVHPMDLQVLRQQIETTLAAQDVESLASLEKRISHAIPPSSRWKLPEELAADEPVAYLTSEHEDAYLARLDGRLGDHLRLGGSKDDSNHQRPSSKEASGAAAAGAEDRHWAEITPREIERLVELHNPQSQHNWIKTHAKSAGGLLGAAADGDDADYLASPSHDGTTPARPTRGAAAGSSKRNLAKQVGDRAVERAREGLSPSAASPAPGDEDELSFVDDPPGAGGSVSKRKSKGDVDGTYRLKGSKGSAQKGKRKRPSGEDGVTVKRVKTDFTAE